MKEKECLIDDLNFKLSNLKSQLEIITKNNGNSQIYANDLNKEKQNLVNKVEEQNLQVEEIRK